MGRAVAVCVVGLGRVGLPTAAMFAAEDSVVGVDRDPAVLSRISRGEVGCEPGLAASVSSLLASGALELADHPVPASAYVLCVPTPLTEQRTADLSALYAAVGSIEQVAAQRALIVIESTVPVGTTDALAGRLRHTIPGARVAHCPERVLPGDALAEIISNDRLVGGVDVGSTQAAVTLLSKVIQGTLHRTDAITAELAKLVENASRDVELALAHTVAQLAEVHGVNPWQLRALVNQHPRVHLLEPGIGVGGHCLPIDPWFLVAGAPGATALLRTARRINDGVPELNAQRIRRMVPPPARVAVLGLAYKPDIDDLRGSPALAFARALAADYDVVVTDPFVAAPDDLRGVSLGEALAREVVVLAVAHTPYRALTLRGDQIGIDLVGGWR
ncbi:MAG TPA: nucleotide sugar dehydrogenase [Deltaproteobacteria bacterium]|nr:nucleotide sugar dehydrogenase [Deltaproteobacteria bacterium]